MKAATLLLCMALVAGSMAQISSPYDLVTANPDTFKILTALINKADASIGDALKNGQLQNTYFLPIDESFLYDISNCWPAAGAGEPGSNSSSSVSPTVEDILTKINGLSSTQATDVIKAHVVGGKNLASTKELVNADSVATALSGYNLTFANGGSEPLYVSVTVMPLDDSKAANMTWDPNASLKVPVAIPAGNSTVYLTDKMLADPAIISGSPCPAVGSGAPSPSPILDASPSPALDNSTDTAVPSTARAPGPAATGVPTTTARAPNSAPAGRRLANWW